MHTLNARVIAAQLVEERIDTATRRRRRFGRAGRAGRIPRDERDGSSSSPIPGRLRPSGAGR